MSNAIRLVNGPLLYQNGAEQSCSFLPAGTIYSFFHDFTAASFKGRSQIFGDLNASAGETAALKINIRN